jgi:hypothetical protein
MAGRAAGDFAKKQWRRNWKLQVRRWLAAWLVVVGNWLRIGAVGVSAKVKNYGLAAEHGCGGGRNSKKKQNR